MVREARLEARRRGTYGLRWLGAGLLLTLFLILFWTPRNIPLHLAGRALFNRLNFTLFGLIWIGAPFLTADCLSRERREGTLGLLFLTPLNGTDVVFAKGVVQAIRGIGMALAVVPILTVPVLMGGVSQWDLMRAVLLDAGALVLALVMGLFASAWCREWRASMLVALSLSAGSALLFVSLYGLGRALAVFHAARVTPTWGILHHFVRAYLRERFVRQFSSRGLFPGVAPASASSADLLALGMAAGLLILAIVLACLVIRWAGRRIESSWRDRPESARQAARRWFWLRPRFARDWYRRRQRHLLEGNPIRWLQQYATWPRAAKWFWLLLVVIYNVVLFGNETPWDDICDWEGFGFLGLSGIMALTAAASFRRERRAGTFELLLISPLPPRRIWLGRWLGLLAEFAPAFLLLLWAAVYTGRREGAGAASAVMVATFFAAMTVGLYFSFKLPVLLAWVCTLFVAFVLPWAVCACLGSHLPGQAVVKLWVLSEAIPFFAALGLMQRLLNRRGFAFSSTGR